ncbi:acyl-CoA dehydrogenase family protein [Candidatus Poriferisocius sp.]|uniref:acyl-CoA dehydrogenase family protein n=1 Tax=Candidatus Poriferisocius sp. TaxID=3101276 RepID=UPI003B5C58BE
MSATEGLIDADDLALLATGFEAAMAEAPGPAEADVALYELGWGELLAAAPAQGAAVAFSALGEAGSAAGLIDDVVVHALGLEVSVRTAAVLPAPHRAAAPARRQGDTVVIDGLVSARAQMASIAVVAVDDGGDIAIGVVDTSALGPLPTTGGLDPGDAYRRLWAEIPAAEVTPAASTGTWEAAVAAARIALAHQLVGGARWMLAEARQHAVDRRQFGRPVASFQAIRHKLAESLVEIEGAASVAAACVQDQNPLLAALAKSLAGQAAHTTATHAQQVLAGIGFTAEHQFHRRLKRMLVVDTLFGSTHSLPTEIGHTLLTQATAPHLLPL